MFKSEKIYELLEASHKSPMELSRHLWGPKTHTAISYFRGRTDIRTDLLEKLALYFDVPMETFFDMPDKKMANHIVGSHNNVGNFNISGDAERENVYLKQNMETLKELVKSKEDLIWSLKKQIDTIIQATANQQNT